MLSHGMLCLVVGGDFVGASVILTQRVMPGDLFEYYDYHLKNSSTEPMWVTLSSDCRDLLILERHLMPLRGDENPTTELSGVQRSDTVGA